ncbi:protein kinase domain-containing protein [Kovacikia minuta]|uniref:protein kinase domain-containing protein n=1 Tax=Kovacikia minuta TaxID=2931930 RepID=UPI0020C814AC|nr:protein kinase [Kovacikia minuta]
MNASQMLDPWIGQLIGDRQRYRLERRLGGGGMGEVFLAMDTLLGQPVALKLLDAKLASGDLRRRFEQEVTVITALRSQHIVQVIDHGVTSDGYPFYVMEYLQGRTLGQLLYRERPLSVERSVSIVMQVCAGLQLRPSRRELAPKRSRFVPTGSGHSSGLKAGQYFFGANGIGGTGQNSGFWNCQNSL